MQPSWRLPEEIEKPFRDGLDHVAKQRGAELQPMLKQLSAEQLAGIVNLSCLVTAYTALDVAERRWPSDAQVRRMAQGVVKDGNRDDHAGVTEQNVYLFLSQCALGFKPYEDVFADVFTDPPEFFAAPLYFTANMLATFVPNGKTIWQFLDLIESSYEGAWLLDLNVLPALMVRARMPQPDQGSGTSSAGQ
jgi:hypothetical protein